MDEQQKIEQRLILNLTSELLGICEATGQFPFRKSRATLAAGEAFLVMAGVIRFVNGNPSFKSLLSADHANFVERMTKLLEPQGSLRPYAWTY